MRSSKKRQKEQKEEGAMDTKDANRLKFHRCELLGRS
jgi:hypothetical protein